MARRAHFGRGIDGTINQLIFIGRNRTRQGRDFTTGRNLPDNLAAIVVDVKIAGLVDRQPLGIEKCRVLSLPIPIPIEGAATSQGRDRAFGGDFTNRLCTSVGHPDIPRAVQRDARRIAQPRLGRTAVNVLTRSFLPRQGGYFS